MTVCAATLASGDDCGGSASRTRRSSCRLDHPQGFGRIISSAGAVEDSQDADTLRLNAGFTFAIHVGAHAIEGELRSLRRYAAGDKLPRHLEVAEGLRRE